MLASLTIQKSSLNILFINNVDEFALVELHRDVIQGFNVMQETVKDGLEEVTD